MLFMVKVYWTSYEGYAAITEPLQLWETLSMPFWSKNTIDA